MVVAGDKFTLLNNYGKTMVEKGTESTKKAKPKTLQGSHKPVVVKAKASKLDNLKYYGKPELNPANFD